MAFPSSQTLIDDNPHTNPHNQHQSSPSEECCEQDLQNPNSNSPTPIRFIPLRHVSSNVVSKKVRARKLTLIHSSSLLPHPKELLPQPNQEPKSKLPPLKHVYFRRRYKKSPHNHFTESSPIKFVNSQLELHDIEGFFGSSPKKKRRLGNSELLKLGFDSTSTQLSTVNVNAPRLRHLRCQDNSGNGTTKRKERYSSAKDRKNNLDKRWLLVALDGVDPLAFLGFKCKVFWPLDNAWYKGTVTGYDNKSKHHKVKYDDGDEEELNLLHEQIKFHISEEEMHKLNIISDKCKDGNDPDYNQLIGLAATMDESQELEPGDIIWAKLAGYAMWPAVILDEALISKWKGLKLKKYPGGRSVPVQFFGSHDFARIQAKQAISFAKGLISCFHLKCKSPQFLLSLKEARMYLNEQRLPSSMLSMQRAYEDVQTIDSSEDSKEDEELSASEGVSKLRANKMLKRYNDMPRGYRPIDINCRDLDRCNVCHMDEEYENNLFQQCDKCRMMVHARCYGEQSVDGVLWLCNLCRDGAPEVTPPCRLCPVAGGAMKPTTDGHWAHLACAIWIPETCFSDITKMEPIDGLSRINKDRWKLLCSICGVPYGACIQCSNSNCRVAYHPLCARAAGLCVELEDEDKLHLTPIDEEDEDQQCIRLLSFCKRHKQPAMHFPTEDELTEKNTSHSSYDPPPNKSGCARCEPYDYSSRRGRKEPEVLAAASMKSLFLENMPYLVGGDRLLRSLSLISEEDKTLMGSGLSSWIQNRTSSLGSSGSILSMADKYKYMRETFRKRLAFGKSRIHGYGIFAKQPHKAGDMVIEYTGEIVRPPVADRREHLIYNSLVGAGTYMFRIDDERVVDATRAGSIAHLINHSCEPNCYSRAITVSGDEHIIIFAKRDIKQWEELTYDYRFLSVDEQLKCYCGSKQCRGIVNDAEAGGQASKLCVRRSELIDWNGK